MVRDVGHSGSHLTVAAYTDVGDALSSVVLQQGVSHLRPTTRTPYRFTLDSALLASNADLLRQPVAQIMHYAAFHYDCEWALWHDGNVRLEPWHPMVPSPVPYPELELTKMLPDSGTIVTTPECPTSSGSRQNWPSRFVSRWKTSRPRHLPASHSTRR